MIRDAISFHAGVLFEHARLCHTHTPHSRAHSHVLTANTMPCGHGVADPAQRVCDDEACTRCSESRACLTVLTFMDWTIDDMRCVEYIYAHFRMYQGARIARRCADPRCPGGPGAAPTAPALTRPGAVRVRVGRCAADAAIRHLAPPATPTKAGPGYGAARRALDALPTRAAGQRPGSVGRPARDSVPSARGKPVGPTG